MRKTFEAKVCLVTGGSSGIGRATISALEKQGAYVWNSDVVEPETGDRFLRCDVRDAGQVRDVIARITGEHGQLDLAVNCAGIEGVRAPTAQYPDESWQDVIAVNLTGVFHCLREQLGVLAAQGFGAVVNVSSVAGILGFARHAAYTASKHGVIGLTKSAALEYAPHGVRVNAVCPAYTDTPMLNRVLDGRPETESRLLQRLPLGRFGTAEEVASAILYLGSEEASLITGQAVLLDGGLTAG